MTSTVLNSYMQSARQHKPLSFEEEQKLAHEWRDEGKLSSAHKLMHSYLRLVVKVATSFRGYGLPVDEMIQEGNIGLLQAIARFDPEKGFRLSTYALWWIRASMQEYILNNWSLVKIGTSSTQKKLFFNLRRLRAQALEMGAEHLDDKARKLIADELGVKESDVTNMDQRLHGTGDLSLNTTIGGGDDDTTTEWQDWLEDDRPSQEDAFVRRQEGVNRRKALVAALNELDERERAILVARRLREDENTPTLEDLSQEYGVSRERIRQLENRAFSKLQKHMTKSAA